MEQETLRSRLVTLMQRSRQAHRLYSSMERTPKGGEGVEFTERQASEWRSVNAELVRFLSSILDAPNPKALGSKAVSVRDHYYEMYRVSEAELHVKQRELLLASEKGDFVKAAILSGSLVALKARMQASQAAHHELDQVVSQCRLAAPVSLESVVEESSHFHQIAGSGTGSSGLSSVPAAAEGTSNSRAKIIPLRRVQG